jgi:hypothetical protein
MKNLQLFCLLLKKAKDQLLSIDPGQNTAALFNKKKTRNSSRRSTPRTPQGFCA